MPRKRTQIPASYNDAFPARLREIMKLRDLTQQNVADAIGKTRQSVSCYADGTSSPDWKTIVDLSKFLNVSTDWLFGLIECRSMKGNTNMKTYVIRHEETLVDYFYVDADSPEAALEEFQNMVNEGKIDFSRMEMIESSDTVERMVFNDNGRTD